MAIVNNYELAPVFLRIIVGIIFIVHGYSKLFKDFGEIANWLLSIGFKPCKFWAFILGVTEFFGGLLILVGFVSRIPVSLLIIVMVIANYFKIFKWNTPFTKGSEAGYEYELLILFSLIALFIIGSEALSIDMYLNSNLG